MRYVRNVIWEPFAGLYLGVAWLAVSFILFVTVIGIPLARQTLKVADFMLWPYGRAVTKRPVARPDGVRFLGRLGWGVLAGSWLAVLQVVVSCLLMATIVGAPLGIALLRMLPVTLTPFSREVVDAELSGTIAEWRRGPRHLLRLPTY